MVSGTIGAVGGAVVGHEDAETFKEMHGITDELVNEVGGMVQPGRSAVFILVHAADPEPVLAQFRGYGGRILRTTLRPVERRRLQETLSEPAATE